MKKFILLCMVGLAISATAANLPLSIFPLKHYSQSVDDWLKPSDPNYQKPLVSKKRQKQWTKQFYQHAYGNRSPWSETWINHILNPKQFIKAEKQLLHEFSTPNNAIAENYRPYPPRWINTIKNNIELKQFNKIIFHSAQRAVITTNTNLRILPTNDPAFQAYQIPGQGYPFDQLQNSSLWIGTAVYTIAQTRDQAWTFVLTPSVMGWVPSNHIATMSTSNIHFWRKQAKRGMMAITHTKAPLFYKKQFFSTTYIGTVLPLQRFYLDKTRVLVPNRLPSGRAQIISAIVDVQYTTRIPQPLTRQHLAEQLKTLIQRPYGWGGLYFYNDCSQELKNLFTAFGIWLPRNSLEQSHYYAHKDLAHLSTKARINYVKKYAKPLLTILYTGGHVVLYLGKFNKQAVIYQNKWGLKPANGSRRAILGGTVIMPLLPTYPEDPSLQSQAGRKHFVMTQLGEPNQRFLESFSNRLTNSI